ncbi:MAG: orotidine-5'-phosphate decarboxylase [Candidatus Thiodiazotropha endolucinida]|uniref:Orotidine 5'-phosphate decarboxylase n=2 Tax=Candidatus Thiodiazotropha TaxID=1913444 RepID=A0A7Z0VN47_9GAMM|nr:orotidine-5'-phosphate decarboxylase [Candidatus Thiodiazotropha endolucinida]MBT3030526.1 orotidine-5'-phosphate decarboxylase [Candidatus Thiodiazotropha sp. (ex Lucina pensylvanica)]MBT3043980.1 orotidine-5'-phosphate decarboxylase [Candidatus Thiodiazotropha sp. (ex Codakia orbicularis)]MBV2125656.1 orotidine-5'-phosphate decarboxylase [Candidatus Thiodiazotropha taylori]MBT3049941.1 orotidine-5'-phosphate decarboxylase [Candidatus Thiodiazotropha sp. (ex Codakia orbicularis)]MBT3054716
MNSSESRVIVALDYSRQDRALALVDRLDPSLCRLKVGKEMFTRLGPSFIEVLRGRGYEVFLDLKFHDIPNTVAAACDAAADLGVWMMNLHASGGRRMMEAARERLESRSNHPRLIAVTILTSLTGEEIQEIGFSGDPADNVLRLAKLTQQSGLDGVVCSPREAEMLRGDLGHDFLLVTPGVRPKQATQDDQRRVMTPADAINAGSSYLVVGRPITAAADPIQALQSINLEIAANL